jgi:hypothetical protein
MSRESRDNKIYEARVVEEALARLLARIDRPSLPLSDEELKTLVKRSREAYYSRGPKKERLARYQAHLARSHGAEVITSLAKSLEDVLNEIGWEEK